MSLRLSLVAAFGGLFLGGAVQAATITTSSVTITAQPVSTVSALPFALANLGNAGINGLVSTASIGLTNGTISFSNGSQTMRAGVYDGDSSGISSPTGSINYLAALPGGDVVFAFNTPQDKFQLLWGTVDDYNSLTFTRTNGTSLTVTGADIRAVDGTTERAFVIISGLGTFNRVVASSSSPGFEFLPNVAVPEPGTLALIGVGLGSLAWMRRRRVN